MFQIDDRYNELREKYGTIIAREIRTGEIMIEKAFKANSIEQLKPILVELIRHTYKEDR